MHEICKHIKHEQEHGLTWLIMNVQRVNGDI